MNPRKSVKGAERGETLCAKLVQKAIFIKDIKVHGFEENVIAVGKESGIGQGGYALSYLNVQDCS